MTEAVLAPKPVHPLRVRDFRLLWAGESISLLGDQFYLIALPWLVLQLTGSALALGTVMALASIPRALFMLVGGVLVDRFSPRKVIFASNLIRMILVGLLSVLVLSNSIQLWMLYVLALAFGTADAFLIPAHAAMVPTVLHSDQLEMGNSLTQGTAMLSVFLGPVIAGIVIAALAGGNTNAESVPSLQGIGIAFAFDSLSFLASLVCLWLIHPHEAAAQKETGVLTAIKEGMAYAWNSAVLRALLIVMIAINLLVVGPFEIGIPVLANDNLAEGAAAFGILISAFGGGALIGVILASALPKPSPAHFGSVMMIVTSLLGVFMILLPLTNSTAVAALISLGMGITNGYVNVHVITWLQRRIPEQLMGRVMSMIMFAAMGVAPVSSTVAGAILNVNVPILFIGAGTLMTLTTLFFLTQRPIREMGLEVVVPAPETEAVEATEAPLERELA